MKYLIVLTYFFYCASGAFAQKLNGRVLDAVSKQPVPYASIRVLNSTLGTTSNAEGEFELSSTWLPGRLIVMDLSHIRDTVQVVRNDFVQVQLQPAAVKLPDVVVTSFTADLLKKAYRRLRDGNALYWYSTAFYRQVTRLDNQVTEIQEMVWAAKSNNSGLKGIALQQARYGEKKKALINFKDFPTFTRSVKIYSAASDTGAITNVIGPNVDQYYDLKMLGFRQDGPRELVEVSFATKPGANTRNISGSVLLDNKTYQVLRFRVNTPDVHYSSNNPTFSFRNSTTSFELTFQPVSASESTLELIQVNHHSTLHRPLQSEVTIDVSSVTTFDHGQTQPLAGVTYTPASEGQLSLATLKKTVYNPEFWKNNSLIKRTPAEEETIATFEQGGIFGTMAKE